MSKFGPTCASGFACLFLFGSPAAAEIQLSVYGGSNFPYASDVTIVRPGGTNTTFKLPWEPKPFATPPYWGVRATYWLSPQSSWGFGIDYTHAKVYGDLNATVSASGTIGGVNVGPQFLMSKYFTHFEFTDGENMLTAHVLYRWQYEKFTPYVGVGLGASIPHVEVWEPGYPDTWNYQLGGIAARLYAGIEYRITPAWSLFSEYQFSFNQDDVDLSGGGTLKTNIWNHHVNLGLSYRFNWF
jgi:lipid A oxidase